MAAWAEKLSKLSALEITTLNARNVRLQQQLADIKLELARAKTAQSEKKAKKKMRDLGNDHPSSVVVGNGVLWGADEEDIVHHEESLREMGRLGETESLQRVKHVK